MVLIEEPGCSIFDKFIRSRLREGGGFAKTTVPYEDIRDWAALGYSMVVMPRRRRPPPRGQHPGTGLGYIALSVRNAPDLGRVVAECADLSVRAW